MVRCFSRMTKDPSRPPSLAEHHRVRSECEERKKRYWRRYKDRPDRRTDTFNGASASFYKPSIPRPRMRYCLSLRPNLSDYHGPAMMDGDGDSATVAQSPQRTRVFQTTFFLREMRVKHRCRTLCLSLPSSLPRARNQLAAAAGVARFDAPF